jgi:peptide-methionine (S)-S-oxide reductase
MENSQVYGKATFAAGCFWGVEAAFRHLPGVVGTIVGYTGGSTENPTYVQVCEGKTGHAEAVEVTFDPRVISFEDLLNMFWKIHDPTQLNRQGPDVGSNYRSAVFYHTPEQKAAAEKSLDKLQSSGSYGTRRIVTGIVPAARFWPAEDYHQQYYEKCGRGYCATRQMDE